MIGEERRRVFGWIQLQFNLPHAFAVDDVGLAVLNLNPLLKSLLLKFTLGDSLLQNLRLVQLSFILVCWPRCLPQSLLSFILTGWP